MKRMENSHPTTLVQLPQTVPYTVSRYPSKSFAKVKLNGCCTKLKIDTGADTCILTANHLQNLPFTPSIKPSHTV